MSEFKVGDRVYCPIYSEKIFTVDQGYYDYLMIEKPDLYFNKYGIVSKSSHPCIFHATPENHALLSQLYPSVEFEKPRLTGSDLTRQKLENGEKYILCWVGDVSDHIATQDKRIQVVTSKGANGCFIDDARENWFFAVPVPRNFYAMDDE